MPPSSTAGSVDFVRLGFDVSDAPAMVMARPHRHDEIEITVLERGWNDYLFGGRRVRIPGGALCVRWAAIPHQSLAFDPGGTHYSLKVPLAWFLGWQLPESLVSRLLGGELLIDTRQDPESTDLALLRRWHRAFRSGSPPLHRMILLEAQARLLRLAVEFPPAQTPRGLTTVTGQLGRFEQMTVYIAGNSPGRSTWPTSPGPWGCIPIRRCGCFGRRADSPSSTTSRCTASGMPSICWRVPT